jgi:hypothetical protein
MTDAVRPSGCPPRTSLRLLLGPILASLLLHLGFLAAYLAAHHGDLGRLVCVAAGRAGQPPYEVISRPLGRGGYDGQFYYALARAPWKAQEHPPRHLRILYPAVCWLCSLGGGPRRLLWVMPAVNLVAIAGLAGVGAWQARRRGLSPWWGVLLPLAVNVGLPLLRDLTDPVSTLAVSGLLVAVLVGAPDWSVLLWAGAAVFSREQNVLIAGLLLGTCLWKGRLRLAVGITAVLALWLAWVGLLRSLYGDWPFLGGQGNFGVPFVGLLSYCHRLVTRTSYHLRGLAQVVVLLHLLLLLGLGVFLLIRRGNNLCRVTTLLGLALAVGAGRYIYGDVWAHGRVLVWLPLGLWLGGVETRRRWLLLLLTPLPLMEVLAAVRGLV